MDSSKKLISAVYPAVGGPKESKNTGGDFNRIPTKAGTFMFDGQPFVYANPNARYVFSRVPWNSKMRLNGDNVVEFRLNNVWKSFEEITHWDVWNSLDKLLFIIKEAHPGRDVPLRSEFPKRWILNDYGHITISYFSDKNKNGIRDQGERIENDMIHPTPFGELQKSVGIPNAEIALEESHGCIHMTPDDIDEMIARGYVKKGNRMLIHSYSDVIPGDWSRETNARAPYDVHFFPGVRKIVITGEI